MPKSNSLSYTRQKRYFSPLLPAITILKKKASLARKYQLKERTLKHLGFGGMPMYKSNSASRISVATAVASKMSSVDMDDQEEDGEEVIEWGYNDDGTAEWGLHFPEANGDSQSPINLVSREAVFDDSLNLRTLKVSYVPCRESEMINTGNTVQISLRYKADTMTSLRDHKSDPHPRSYLVGGPFADEAEYELAEFMFHWGKEDDRGSEHTVNLKAYPMELHLVHWNNKYDSLQEAMGKSDGIAIIALFIQVGREHSGLRIFTDYLEAVQYKGRSLTITTPFNPNCLLPDPQLRDFWTYQGSLTTPPCFENVTWILFRYPLTISHSQMEEFRRLKNHLKGETPARGDEGFLVDNFRPTQPLNERVVRASFQ